MAGEKKRRRERFFQKNPMCCFCGGMTPAAEIDHQPPKVFFKDKSSPPSLRFPSCVRCNRGSSVIDQIFGFYATLDPTGNFSLEPDRFSSALKAFHQQYPTIKPFHVPSREKRQALRRLGIRLPRGEIYANAPVIGYNPNVFEAIELSIVKQSVAIYYLMHEKIVPPGSGIIAIVERDIHSIIPEQLKVLGLDVRKMVRFKNPNKVAEEQLAISTQYNQRENFFAVSFRHGLSLFSTVAIFLGATNEICSHMVTSDPFPWRTDLETLLRGEPEYFYYDQNPAV